MTDDYSIQNSMARRTCEFHIKRRAIKFLYIVESISFYELPVYNGTDWLELRN